MYDDESRDLPGAVDDDRPEALELAPVARVDEGVAGEAGGGEEGEVHFCWVGWEF